MQIDPAVKKETRYILGFSILLSAVMELVFYLCGHMDYTVPLGNLLGVCIAVLNFFLMGLTVQKCLELEPDEAKKRMKFSQQMRYLMLVVVCVIGAAVPFCNTIAVLVPQFFPRVGVTIRGMTLKNE